MRHNMDQSMAHKISNKSGLSEEEEDLIDEMKSMLRLLGCDDVFMRINEEYMTFTSEGIFYDDLRARIIAPREIILLEFFNFLEERVSKKVNEMDSGVRMENLGLLLGHFFGLSGLKDEYCSL